jgi:hypothetical protein
VPELPVVQLPVIKTFGGATSGSEIFLVQFPVQKNFGATSAYKNFMAQLPKP